MSVTSLRHIIGLVTVARKSRHIIQSDPDLPSYQFASNYSIMSFQDINASSNYHGRENTILRGFLLFGVNAGTFFGLNLIYFLISKIPSMSCYKIQPKQETKLNDWIKCAKLVACNYIFLILPLMVTSSYMKGESRPWPVWYRAIMEIVLAAMLDDFLLYWLHRISHWPSMYFIHKAHHEFTAPFGLESAYMHPAEVFLVALCSGAGGFLILTSVYQIIPLLAYRAFLNVEHHCGYAYPWNPQNWLPVLIGAHFHDYHHEAFIGNFGVMFNCWDIVFGTVNPKYWSHWEEFKISLFKLKGA